MPTLPKPTGTRVPTRIPGGGGNRRPGGSPRPRGRSGGSTRPPGGIPTRAMGVARGAVGGGGIKLAPSDEQENNNQQPRGGRMRRYGQQAKVAAGAARGAAKGAVKGGIKGAKRGSKIGGTAGKGFGAGAGAAIGSVIPGAGTAAGAKIGSQIGGVTGKGVGAAAGAGAGAGIGAAQGAREGAANARAKQQANAGAGGKAKQSFRKKAEKKVEDAAIKHGSQIAASSLGNPEAAPLIEKAARIALKYEKIKRKAFLWLIAIAAVLIFFLLFFIFGGGDQPPKQDQDNGKTPITVTVTCDPPGVSPNLLKVGDSTVCTISVADTESAEDITVVATISSFADYVNNTAQMVINNTSKPAGTYDATQKTVTWDAKQLKLPLTAPVSLTFKLTVKVTQPYNNTPNAHGAPIVAVANGTGGSGSTACTATGSPDMEAKWQQVLKLGQQYGPLWISFLNSARSIAQQQDYPLAVIVGQGAHESAHGTSNFAVTRNNFFGFDAFDNNVNAAKTYPNPAASITDYVNLIKGGNGGSNQLYLQAYANRADPTKMVQLIKAGGYASDPNYVSEVTSVQEFQILSGVSLPCN